MDKTTETLMDILKASQSEVGALGKIASGNQAFSSLVKGIDEKETRLKLEEELKAQRLAEEAQEKLDELKRLEEVKRKAEMLSKGYIFISTITGGELPTSGIDHEIKVYPKGTWDSSHEVNIPSIDPHYHWDADLLEMMALCMILGERGLLVGMPGTGKTSATKQMAAWKRQPFARFNGKEGIEPASLLGYAWADREVVELKDGSEQVVPVMKFKEGLMPMAVREGYLTVIDEVMKLSPGIQMSLQSLYEKEGFLMLDDKPGTIADKQVHPADSFLLFCTDNTCGVGDNLDLFAASQLQDTSTLDRFGFTYEVSYLPPRVEVGMLCGMFPSVDERDFKDLVSLAGLVRNAYKNGDLPVTLSPRGLMTMGGTLNLGLPWEHSIRIVFANKLGEDSHVSKCRELVNTVR